LRKSFLLALSLCLLSCPGLSAQQSSVPHEIVLSIAPTIDPYEFMVSLRNVSGHGLTMVLGIRCGPGSNGHETVGLVHYTLTKSDGEQVDFGDTGMLPCAGLVGVLTKDLPPGESYSYNLDVRNTSVAAKEVFFRLLTSGRELLRIQALADGQETIDGWKGTNVNIEKVTKYPLWRGRVSSELVSLAPPPAPQSHSQP